MHALRPYPLYKESSVPWLGKMPAHWEVRRLRTVAEMRVSNVDKLSDDNECAVSLCNYTDVYNHDRIRAGMNFMKATATADEIERFRLRSGDVLITKDSEAWNDIGVPALVESTEDELVSGYHLALLRPDSRQLLGAYLRYALLCVGVADQFHVGANGVTRFGLTQNAIKSVWLPLAPFPEQFGIVRFLDHADRRIQRYIRAKEKLIALVEEQKRAVIHQAVTGRIDVRTGQPYPAYKPSGVEWLGEVPHHWNVRRLHQCGTMVGGMTPSMVERRFWDGEIPWVTPKDMKRESIRDSGVQVTKAALRETSIRLIGPPAVLMVVRGMILARKVPIAWITNCVTINQDMKAVVPTVGIKAEFLARALDSAQDALATLIDEAGHGTRRLPTERLRTLAVAIPSEDEQSLVVRFVDRTTAKIDKRIADTRREIDLLREYRTRLIADAVTGKLDVRRAAAALPEEPDDPDAVEADCAGPEGRDDDRADRDPRTEVPATQGEMTS